MGWLDKTKPFDGKNYDYIGEVPDMEAGKHWQAIYKQAGYYCRLFPNPSRNCVEIYVLDMGIASTYGGQLQQSIPKV